ncbi:hypothetical protein MBLNU459_g0666t1 [Dothideomycetes sp. NU459]
MPPHDRLCWRFKPLLQSQVAHISKKREPLLFLYPRWFTSATSEPQVTAGEPQEASQDERRRRKMVDPRDRHIRQARVVASEVAQDRDPALQAQTSPENPLDSRPSSGLVRKIIVKRDHEGKKLRRKWDLRDTYRDSRDWRTSLDILQRATPSRTSFHVKQLERLTMPEGMFGWYPGDLNELFLEIKLLTECHVQLLSDDINHGSTSGGDGTRFYSLVLAGTPSTIRMARERLNDEIRVRSDGSSQDGGSMGAYTTTSSIIKREKAAPRAVWSQHRARIQATSKPSIENLPRRWTTITFANHIDDLVNRSMPRMLQRRIYGLQPRPSPNQESHIDAVAVTILDLFLAPTMMPVISPYSCASAFRFLLKHRKLPELRRILELLDNHDFVFSTGMFNPCLQAARDAGDLHNFHFVLRLMVDRHVRPDWESWSALVALVNQVSRRDARVVLKGMRKKGLLVAAPAKMDVAAAFVKEDFTDWVERGGSTASFVETYGKHFDGPDWLNENVANRMLGVRAQRGQFGDAFSILDLLITRGKRPNTVSLNILLSAAVAQRNPRAALESVNRLVGDESSAGVRPDKITFDRLFRLAWRRGEYNMLRVAWRYACMHGEVSSALQEAFEGTITLYTPSSKPVTGDAVSIGPSELSQTSRPKLFRSLAAKVAVGLREGLGSGDSAEREDGLESTLNAFDQRTKALVEYKELNRILVAQGTQPQPTATVTAELDKEHDGTIQETHAQRRRQLLDLVKSDLQQVQRLQPLVPLAKMLQIAWKRDLEWTGLRVRKTPDLAWILENAVQIPVALGAVPSLRSHEGTFHAGNGIAADNDSELSFEQSEGDELVG